MEVGVSIKAFQILECWTGYLLLVKFSTQESNIDNIKVATFGHKKIGSCRQIFFCSGEVLTTTLLFLVVGFAFILLLLAAIFQYTHDHYS